jgi:hypothetical protein
VTMRLVSAVTRTASSPQATRRAVQLRATSERSERATPPVGELRQ